MEMVSCIKPRTQAPPQQKRRSLGTRLVVLKQLPECNTASQGFGSLVLKTRGYCL